MKDDKRNLKLVSWRSRCLSLDSFFIDCVLAQCCPLGPRGVHAVCVKWRRPQISSPEQTVPREIGKEQCWYVLT